MKARTFWSILGIVVGATVLIRTLGFAEPALPFVHATTPFMRGFVTGESTGHAAAPFLAAAMLLAGLAGLPRRPRRNR